MEDADAKIRVRPHTVSWKSKGPVRLEPVTKGNDSLTRALRYVHEKYHGDVGLFFREIRERDARVSPIVPRVNLAALVNRCHSR
jgi:hypothetical protein